MQTLMRSDRRAHSRIAVPIDVVLRWTDVGPGRGKQERTIFDNISRRGARVMTALTGVQVGDEVDVAEVGDDFQTRATVRHASLGSDHIRRLGLEFKDRTAPDRLMPAAPPQQAPGTPARPPAPGGAGIESGDLRAGEPRTRGVRDPDPNGVAAAGAPRLSRREIIEAYETLKTGTLFDVLGIPRASDARAVKEAYRRRARLFHPDSSHDPRIVDLSREIGAVFIKLGEAYEVLSDPRRRGEYENRLGPNPDRRPPRASPRPAGAPAPESPPAAAGEAAREPPPSPSEPAPAAGSPSRVAGDVAASLEKAIARARSLLANEQYWDAIQAVEAALAGAGDRPDLRHKLQILLARGLRANTRWAKRAEQVLRSVLGEDGKNVAAWFELGLLYKEAGFPRRAERAFTRVVDLAPGHQAARDELAAAEPVPREEGRPRRSLQGGERDQ